MRLYPKPGMFTHISRGIESIPAVFVSGSIVRTIMVSERGAPRPASQSRKSKPINKTLIRLAPSQAGGRSDSGILIEGGGSTSDVATGVPSMLRIGPSFPAETVPQLAGAVPGRDVIVQQETIPRIKKNPPSANISTMPQKISWPSDKGPSFAFLKLFSLFIRVLNIPCPIRVVRGLLLPSIARELNHLPKLASSPVWREDREVQPPHAMQGYGPTGMFCLGSLRLIQERNPFLF